MPPKVARQSTATNNPLHDFGPEDLREYVTDTARGFGRSRATRQYTKQVAYLDEDDDFEPDKHLVGLNQKIQIQNLDLEGEDAHVDAGAELGDGEGDLQRTGMPEESAANKAQFRSDMNDPGLVRNVVRSARKGKPRTVEQVQRAQAVRTQAHREDVVREHMRVTAVPAFERLAAARAVAFAERDRLAKAAAPPPPIEGETTAATAATTSTSTTGSRNRPRTARELAREEYLHKQAEDRERIRAAYTPPAAEAVTVGELTKMLGINPFGELPRKLQVGLLQLPDMAAVVTLLQPLLHVDEFDKRHYNAIEVIESMVMAGAKFVDMQRVKLSARLAVALDPMHYGAYIVRPEGSTDENDAVLAGGHEHFVDGQTSLILIEFRCVRRNLENNTNAAQVKAKRSLGTELADLLAAEAEPIDTNTLDDDGEEADIYDDADDKYDGGNDCKNWEKHFIYKVIGVFVEAVDAKHTDETMMDVATAATNANSAPKSAVDDNEDKSEELSKNAGGGDDDSLDIFALPRVVDPIVPRAPQQDEFRFDGGAPVNEKKKDGDDDDDDNDSDSEDKIKPLGKMQITTEKARTLVGKWHMNRLIGWLNGTQRPAPLCFRSFHISI